MNSLERLAGSSSSPYTSPLKIQVVAKGPVATSNKGTSYRTLGVADTTAAKKMLVFDEETSTKFEEGYTYIIRNYSTTNGAISLNQRSKVAKTSQLVPSASLAQEAQELVFPPPAVYRPVSAITNLLPKTMLSIKGMVVEESMVRTVQVNGTDAAVKDITLEQDGHRVVLTLWRQYASNEDVANGNYLEVENVIVRQYNGKNVVATTSRSSITKMATPSRNVECEVISYEEEGDTIVLNCFKDNDVMDYRIALTTLLQELRYVDISTLEESLPLRVRILMLGNTVQNIEAM